MRLVVGILVMGLALPLGIFLLLGLRTFSDFFAIAASTFVTWGVADLLSSILERPRLPNRNATGAIREDVDRRQSE